MTALPLPRVPASFFGIVLGLSGLANSWRAASQLWRLPSAIGELLTALAVVVWLAVAALYGLKWLSAREEAMSEARHPVQCCFIGLAGVATLLVGLGVLPYSRAGAVVFVILGAAATLGFAFWRTGLLWQGERDHAATTPVLYLPTVAGGFVIAIALSALGAQDWGRLAFGMAFFSWLAIESVLLHRLYTAPTLPAPLRPTLGIQLAPPAVGALAYVSVGGGPSDILAYALLGYALLQAALLLRLLRWIMQAPFSAAYWAFTFGAAALPAAAIRMALRGETGPAEQLAPWLFAAANVAVLAIAAGTVKLLVQGRLLPQAAPAAKLKEAPAPVR